MYEANFNPNKDFKSFQRISKNTTTMYLRARLAEQSDRRYLLELFNQGIIPKLIGLHMKMETTKYPESMSVEMSQLKALVNDAIENAHTITNEIAPHVLFRIGLRAALHELFEKYADNYDINYYINMSNNELGRLDESTNLMIYNLIKKLLNGAVCSCSAEIIGVSLQRKENYIELILQDNGSFAGNIEEIASSGQTREEPFLVETAEQVYSMGGKFWIEKAVGMRTVYASVPLRYVTDYEY
jgi:signal transduction histidine kinase